MSRSVRVAPDCIKQVKIAMKRQAFPSQNALARELGMARSTVSNFLNGIPVDHVTFVEISEKLELDWQAIAYIEDEPLTQVLPDSSPKTESAEKPELVELGVLKLEINQLLELARQLGEVSQPTVSSANLMSEPPTLEKWLGRNREIQQLQVWLSDADVKTIGIQGLSGVGKSWLASYIYEREATESRFSARFWADVSQLPDFAVFAQNALIKLGGKSPEELKDLREPSQLIHQLLQCLKTRPCLLVIDNVETLLERERCFIGAYRDFFRSWKERGTATSKLLLTTQTKPAVMEGLPSWLNLIGLEATDGARLLRELGIQGEESELKEFVELVGGHPKILRLAASQLTRCKVNPHIREAEKLGLREISRALTQLKMPYRDQERVLFVSILEEHFNNLTPELQCFLMNLSIYRRRAFSWQAAAVVLAEGEAPAGYLETMEALEELKGRSLLDEVEIGEERKFQFHPFVWQYIRQKTGEQPEALREKVISYYQSKATDKSTWKTLEDAAPYLEIFHHRFEQKQYTEAFNTLSICDNFLDLRGYNAIRVELYGQLIQAWEPNNAVEKGNFATALVRLGIAYQYLGQFSKVIERCQQALKIAREVGERHVEATALGWIGDAYRLLEQYAQALEFNQQSLEVARAIDYDEWETVSLIDIGHDCRGLGQYQQAIECHQQGLQLAREAGYRRWEAAALGGLSWTYENLGQYEPAIEGYQQALKIYREVGDRWGEARSLIWLGNAYYTLGQYQQAVQRHQLSLEIMRQIGAYWWEGICLKKLGDGYHALRQYQEAINYYQQLLDLKGEVGNSQGEADVLEKLEQIKREIANQIISSD